MIKRIDGSEGWVPANGEKNITFSYMVYGVGTHTFKLFFDNYDGKPNGSGEEHWSKATVEVKPVNGTELKQVGFECDDLYFSWWLTGYGATLKCKAILYNPTSEELRIKQLNGKPDIRISTSAILVQPPELKKSGNIHVSVRSYLIPPQGSTAVEFTSRIGDIPLMILEGALYGKCYSLSLPYTVALTTGDISFVGYGNGQIRRDNGEVLADIGVNIFLLKGSGSALKSVIVLKDVKKAGDAARSVIGFLKEVMGWYEWSHN